jgi:hypothetical protein
MRSSTMATWSRRFVLAGALAVVALAGAAHGSDPPAAQAKTAPSLWMKQKVTASQNVLVALAREDYDAIRLNANSMLAVGYLETFARADTPGYHALMGDFEYANKSLVLAAKNKNLDGATVAYLQLTISCVNCHKIVRDVSK